MILKQLLAQLKPISVEGPTDREVTGIAFDSRRVTPGMLFVAIRGQQADGHDFIQNALERGAVAVICERNGFLPHRATKIKVTCAREALAKVAAAFYQHPSQKLKVIGITGTNGKTTVAFLVKHMLEAAGIRTGLLGTIRYEIGERIIPAQRTTPESLEVHQMLAQMVKAGCQACVMEVSSHALAQRRVLGVQFDVTVFTNLTQDHLDYHGDMEAYFEAKKTLFKEWPDSAKRRTAVINIDDAYGVRLAGETDAEIRVQYAIDRTAPLRAKSIQLGPEGTRMTVEEGGQEHSCRMSLVGRHNVYNALAAIGAVRGLEVAWPTLAKALAGTAPVPGRLESLKAGQPFSVIVDYAHTDDALRNVLVTLREITPGRLLLVFGCGGNRDSGKRAKMGRVAAELADWVTITSDNPRKEAPETIAAQVEAGYRQARPEGCRVELDRRRAIDEAIRAAQPGDTVLIAGKGHETYQEFSDTVIPFDDRVHARETLEALGYRGRR